jgi:hypothetical protein
MHSHKIHLLFLWTTQAGLTIRVTSPPEKRAAAYQTGQGPFQIQLDDGPHPHTTHWWSTLHDSMITMLICDVYQVAAGYYAPHEEKELRQNGLISWRKTWE